MMSELLFDVKRKKAETKRKEKIELQQKMIDEEAFQKIFVNTFFKAF
jgi:hypothetical protein